MSAKSSGTSRPVFALLFGLAATLVIVGVHLCGWDHRAELQALDFRFRRLSTAPENVEVVHVDIDDRSLEELGRWPWPRAQLAGIVDILHRAGARTVALDIILPEPQAPRYVSPATDLYLADTTEKLGGASPRLIFDDKILHDTLIGYPHVFVPMHIDLERKPPPPLEQRLQSTLEEAPDLTPEQAASKLGLSTPPRPDVFARVWKRAVESRVRSIVRGEAGPDLDLRTVAARALPGPPLQARSEEFDVVRREYLRMRALAALKRFTLSDERVEGYPAREGRTTPPLVTIAAAAHRTGFVTVDPDEDGVVRRIPLLARGEEGLFPQFALALGAEELARSHGGSYTLSARAGAVTLAFPDGFTRTIPVDEKGYMLINWIRRRSEETEPRHISTVAPGAGWMLTQSLRRIRTLRRLMHLELLKLAREFRTPEIKDLYWKIVELDRLGYELHRRIEDAEYERQSAVLFSPARVPPSPDKLRSQSEQIDAELDKLYGTLRTELRNPEHLDFFLAKPPDTPPTAATNAADAAEQKRLHARALATYRQESARAARMLEQIDLIDRRTGELQRDLAAQLVDLRRWVGGKLCMVGSIASGAADFVPTPIHKRSPGVVVHFNILNTVVSGAFVRKAHVAFDVAAIVVCGLLVSLLTATRPVWATGPLTLLLALAYAAGNALIAFAQLNVWLVFWAPLGAMIFSFAVVTGWRQLTEERAKRRIRGLFAHALSPALVDRLVEDPSMARLGGERRELTFFFSDLEGFTPLSERLGEEKTVRLLNRYFDRMTDAIQDRCGGYLNKFLGDGLFVFFGAPVLQPDHPARAVRAALECQTEIRGLNSELSDEFGRDVELICRIGIATGEVMVGNCGSSQRMDYTAIGDAVNLTSRLDSANKFFGTRILIADEAWRRGSDETMLARPLGKIRVVGRVEPVAVWNLLAPTADATDEMKRACDDFAKAIEHYTHREFAKAADLFTHVANDLPGDRPAEIFSELCRTYQTTPPPEDWDAVLQLTEK